MSDGFEDVPLFETSHPDTMTNPPFGHDYIDGECHCGTRKDQQ